MKAAVLFALVFSFVCCVASERLVVAVAEDGDGLLLAQRLNQMGYVIYGFYGETVVASSASQVSAMNVVYIGERTADVNYYVLERQERFGVEFTAPLSLPQSSLIAVLHSTFNRLIVSVPASFNLLQAAVVRDLEILPIPTSPMTLQDDVSSSMNAIYERLKSKYTVDPDPIIQKAVEAVSADTLKAVVTYLTGEDGISNILTRNSVSQGAKDASVWIQKNFAVNGLDVSFQEFRTDYSSNVIGIRTGKTEPDKVVVIGAHYDSRGTQSTSPTQRAPGANDNGSGTGAVIHIAQIVNDFNLTFDYTIHFIVYSGEEQGLYGSAAYAAKLVADKTPVVGVLNADMIAYRVSTEPTQCAFPSRYSTPALESLARAAVALYVPALTIGVTPACCSDHQSYYNRGLPATGFFERNGQIADPQYHRSEDLVNRPGYDLAGQYKQLTQGVIATLAVLAAVQPQ